MTAGLPVGIAAWLRIPLSFFLIILLLASSGEASARGYWRGGGTRFDISIESPVTGGNFASSSGTVDLAGVASDSRGITRVTWQSDRGGNGDAIGTESWSVPGIQLEPGLNWIAVTAFNYRGGSRQDRVAVTYTPPITPTDPTEPDRPGRLDEFD